MSLACICGSDAQYDALAVATANALKSAGAKGIYIAGRPGHLYDSLEVAGVTGFAHAGCNVVDLLETAFSALEIDVKGDEK